MKNYLSLLAASLLTSMGAHAVTGELPADENVYIQNVGSGLFLGGANSWGTQGTVSMQGDLFTIQKGEGVYNFLNNDVDLAAAKKNLLGADLYVDGQAGNFEIEEIGDGSGIYLIKSGDKYVAQTTTAGMHTGYTVALTTTPDDAAKWRFLTRTEALDQFADASPDKPKPASFLLGNAGFNRNHLKNLWNITGGNISVTSGTVGASSNLVAESKNSAFDCYQVLENVPNGKYRVSAQACVALNVRPSSGVKDVTNLLKNPSFEADDITTLTVDADRTQNGQTGAYKAAALTDWTLSGNQQGTYAVSDIMTADAYKTDNDYGAPGTPADGTQMFYLRSAWTAVKASLTQNVTLPKGKYRLTMDAKCAGPAGHSATLIAGSASAVIQIPAVAKLPASWVTSKVEFELTEDTEITLGLNVNFASKGGCSFVIDNFKLYDISSETLPPVSHFANNLPYVYANDKKSDFSLSSQWFTMDRGEADLAAVGESFKDGIYNVNPIEVEVTDNTLKVGLAGTRDDVWAVWDNVNIEYLQPIVDLTMLQTSLANAKTEATALLAKPMNATKKANLEVAVNAVPEENAASYNKAISDIANAKADALTSINIYNDVQNKYDEALARLNSTVKVNTFKAATSGIISALEQGTVTDGVKEIADIKKAVIDAKLANLTPGDDITEVIVNPSFETGDLDGWSNNDNQAEPKNTTALTNKAGTWFAEKWHMKSDVNVSQTIKGLPQGTYELSVAANNRDVTDEYLYINSEKQSITDLDAKVYSVQITLTEQTNDVTIGIFGALSTAGDPWFAFDDFKLKYVGKAVDDNNVAITISPFGYATYSSDKNTDFTESGITAFIATATNGSAVLLKKVAKLPAGQGALLFAKNGGNFEAKTTSEAFDAVGTNYFVAVPTQKTIGATTELGYVNCILTVDAATGTKIGIYPLGDTQTATIPAGKSYLSAPLTDVNSLSAIKLVMEDEDITAADEIVVDLKSGKVFTNVAGIKSAKAMKGINITEDGKKVIK